MIKGLRTASIWSSDLNRLLPFYRDTVGLTVGLEEDGFALLGDPNGAAIGLGTHSEVSGPAKEPQRHMVGLETDDIQTDVQRLKSRGVEFIEEPNAPGDGAVTVATFKDPDGNYVQLLQFSGPM